MDPEEEVPLDSVRLAAERTATNRRYKGWSRWKKLICAGLAMLGALIAIVAIAAVVVPMLIKTKHESETKLQVDEQPWNGFKVESSTITTATKPTITLTSSSRTSTQSQRSPSSSLHTTLRSVATLIRSRIATKAATTATTTSATTSSIISTVKTLLPGHTTKPSNFSSDRNEEDLPRQLAKRYAQHMDNSTDPCDDFYQFTCGNYQTEYHLDSPISEVLAQIFVGSDVMESLERKNRAQLVKRYARIDATQQHLPKSVRMSKVLYDICAVKLHALRDSETSPIVAWLRTNAGTDWPLIQQQSFRSPSVSIWDLLGRAKRHLGADSFLSFGIALDAMNPSQYTFIVVGPDLGLENREIYTNAKFKDKLDGYKVEILEVVADYALQARDLLLHRMLTTRYCFTYTFSVSLLSDCSRLKSLVAKVENIIALETKLAAISLAKDDLLLQDRSQIMTVSVANLKQIFPQIAWDRVLSAAIPNPDLRPDRVQIMDSNYLQQLQQILAKTDAETIYNYLIWRLLQSKKLFLDHALKSRREKRQADKEPSKVEMESVCMRLLEKQMPAAVNWVFAQNQSDSHYSRTATLLETIKAAFNERILSLSWLDDNSKQTAKEKLTLMRSSIGFDSWQINAEKLDQFYAGLEFTPNMREFEAITTLMQWNWNRALNALKAPVSSQLSPDIFPSSAIVANAGNSITYNSIMINAGILQFPLYFQGMPDFALFGGLGSILAHEIAHAFGPEGVRFSGRREYKNWLSDRSFQASTEHQSCLARKYTGFCIETDAEEETEAAEICVNEQLAGGEIMADVAGLKIAFESWFAQSKKPFKFPGFESYSPEQLFFLAYANVWCSSRTATAQKLRMASSHPPNRFRVLGALQNFGAFADAFHCDKDSQMSHRAPVCQTW